MKKSYILFILAAVVMFAGCKKDGPAEVTYTTLAELYAKSSPTAANFEIDVKDLVVTAVYKNYAQLEDETAGVQVQMSGHTLQAGQSITGHIACRTRIVSDALLMYSIDASSADISTVTIPCTTVKLSEISTDKVKYYNRRVKLDTITFVNGFKGTEMGAGIFSHTGVKSNAICCPAGLVTKDGSHGDLICYVSGATSYVYSADDFTEYEIEAPITKKNAPGIYSVNGNNVSDVKICRKGIDQYSFGSDGKGNTLSRIQNYASEWVLSFSYPSEVKQGSVIEVNISQIGLGGSISDGDKSVTVEKVGNDRLWAMDYSANLGYVLYYNSTK